MLPIPDRLVFEHPAELSMRSIVERLGQLGSRKAFDVQILDADAVESLDGAGGSGTNQQFVRCENR
jgi:hypothetical protein